MFGGSVVKEGCINDSEFVADVTIPDGTLIAAEASFTKIWRLRNSGTCTWTTAYRFVHVEGDAMGAPRSVAVPAEVDPGDEIELSVTFTAPSSAGDYVSRWKLYAPDVMPFGDRPYILITVEE